MNRTCPETDRECRQCARTCRLQIMDEIELQDHREGVCGPGCPWCDAMVPGDSGGLWIPPWPALAVMLLIGAIGAYTAIAAGVTGATREWCQRAGFEDISMELRPTTIRGHCVWHKPTGDVLIPAEDVRPTPRSAT